MSWKDVPLTYKGEQIGDARLEFSDEGIMVKGTIYSAEKAVEILGPSIEHISFGFTPDGINCDKIEGEAL
jgi:hypothetical protein